MHLDFLRALILNAGGGSICQFQISSRSEAAKRHSTHHHQMYSKRYANNAPLQTWDRVEPVAPPANLMPCKHRSGITKLDLPERYESLVTISPLSAKKKLALISFSGISG
jgi:hypothetical protein